MGEVREDDIAELQIVGDVASLESTGRAEVELRVNGDVVAGSDARGLYGLFWIPELD